MTKKIEEYQLGNETFLEFINLNIYDDFDFISDIIEIDLCSELIDEFLGWGWYYTRTFRLREIEFELILNDTVGMSLKLRKENKSNINSLRRIAQEIVKIIRERSGRYKPVKRKKTEKRLIRVCENCGTKISIIEFETTKGYCKECKKIEIREKKFKRLILRSTFLFVVFAILIIIILYFHIK
jgi:hypothetical protein